MIHTFDAQIAVEYGVNAAILLQNLHYWIEKNRANEVNFFDGKYWTYNSVKAFRELFPYMSTKAINTALAKLLEAGILVTGNYNQSAYDRTLWYAITERGYSILPKSEIHLPKTENEFAETEQPIPDNKPDSKPDIYNNSQKENKQKKKCSSDDGDAPPDVSPASGTDARPKKEEKVFDKDSDAYQAASFLARQKEKHYPDLKPPEEKDLQRWASDFDKCNRIDKRSWDDISDVLRFSQKNAFWRKNILSGKKFREKYDRLLIEMTEENRKNDKR
jgi:hypothetical protein